MSLTSKDMVFGAAGAAAFLGLVVYHQHKFNKLQGEIDELKEETRIMAQYIKILESKVAGDFHTILSSHDHHHHHAHAALSAQPQPAPAVQSPLPQPALEDVKPQVPIIPESRVPVTQPAAQPMHFKAPVRHAAPVRTQPIPQPARTPIRRVAPVVTQVPKPKPPPPPVEESESAEPSQEEEKNKDESESEKNESDDESVVQNSNRRAPPNISNPRAAAATNNRLAPRGRPASPNAGVRSINQPVVNPPLQRHVITVEEGKPPKDKEESYNPAEDNNRATEISGGRPTAPKAGGPRVMGPKSGGEKKRFSPKTDESEDSDKFVSSSRVKTKSILKNPSENRPVNSGSRGDTEDPSMDADLADDMAMVASKSSKREEDNEGREVGQSAARANMAQTIKRAEEMRKRREKSLPSEA